MTGTTVNKRANYVWRPHRQQPEHTPVVRLVREHELLGIKTEVRRMAVLAHFDQAGKHPARCYDPITDTWAGHHLFRASVTLPKV